MLMDYSKLLFYYYVDIKYIETSLNYHLNDNKYLKVIYFLNLQKYFYYSQLIQRSKKESFNQCHLSKYFLNNQCILNLYSYIY